MRSSEFATVGGNRSRAGIWIAVWLVAIFVLALFLRVYWNVEPATADGQFVLSGGSDPYYHKRAVDCIQLGGCAPGQDEWSTLTRDPMLNYPLGSVNVNPPLFEWSVAVFGAILAPLVGNLAEGTWWAMMWSPAIWGALSIFPIYFIGAELFNRRTGIIAALFWTLSTSAIDHSAFGAADHDAMIMFFIPLGFLFYLKAIHGLRGKTMWVTKYSDGASVSKGLSNLFAERKLAFTYALLAGFSLAAVALIWKGFGYMMGIIIVYAVIQMIVDHWRNRDSLAVFMATTITLGAGLLFGSYWYFALGLAGAFYTSAIVMFIGFVLISLMLVPTRDLPTILVLPLFAVGGLLVAGLIYVALPHVWRSLFFALVYFRQNALYQTIAEAHPADFNQIAFAFGPIVMILGVIGLVGLIWTARKSPKRDSMFMAVWAIIAIFMAVGAVRFLFNAVPVVAVLAAWSTDRIVAWLDFGRASRRYQQASGNWAARFGKGIGWSRALAAFAVVIFLVVPTVFLGVEAATPPAYDRQIATDLYDNGNTGLGEFYAKRFGYFGQSYLDQYWYDGLTFLDKWDSPDVQPGLPARYSDPSARPAFLAWWDYGHWAIAIGKHPAVADNFQNGYQFAANYLLAQSENESIQLMANRLVDLLPEAEAKAAIAKGLEGASNPPSADAAYAALSASPDKWKPLGLNTAESVKLLAAIEAAAKTKEGYPASIRYVAADVRMMPVDQFVPLQYRQNLDNVDYGSIFYAPVVLKSGGDTTAISGYVQTVLEAQDSGTQQNPTATGGVRYVTEGEFTRLAERASGAGLRVTGSYLCFKPTFWNSMFFKAYNGNQPPATSPPDFVNCDEFGGGLTSNQVTGIVQSGADPVAGFASPDGRFQGSRPPAPAKDLKHYRLAYIDGDGTGAIALSIIQYVPGATVSGSVLEESGGGTSSVDAVVVAYDDAGRIIKPALGGVQAFFYEDNGQKKDAASIDWGTAALPQPEGFDYLREGPEAAEPRLRRYHAGLPATLNVPHDSTRTDGSGAYTLTVPFGNVTLVAFEPNAQGRASDVELSRTSVQVSRDQAENRFVFPDAKDITVRPGTLRGNLYVDANGNGVKDANETYPASAEALVNVSGQPATVNADGSFEATVRAGLAQVTVDAVGYEAQVSPMNVRLSGGQTVSRDIALIAQVQRAITGTTSFVNANGSAVSAPPGTFLAFSLEGGNQTGTALLDADGAWTTRLASGGTWRVTSEFEDQGKTYFVNATMAIPNETSGDRSALTWDLIFAEGRLDTSGGTGSGSGSVGGNSTP